MDGGQPTPLTTPVVYGVRDVLSMVQYKFTLGQQDGHLRISPGHLVDVPPVSSSHSGTQPPARDQKSKKKKNRHHAQRQSTGRRIMHSIKARSPMVPNPPARLQCFHSNISSTGFRTQTRPGHRPAAATAAAAGPRSFGAPQRTWPSTGPDTRPRPWPARPRGRSCQRIFGSRL